MAILYLDDWVNKHPGAIIHETTNNKSFIHIVKVYEQMGVKNAAWPLALHNKDLADIDPHDPNLGAREVALIVDECSDNPWYFFREILRIPPTSGITSVPFRANRGSLATFWLFFNHITTIVIQPRQTGKTVTMSALMRLLLNISTINTTINFMTLDDVLREETVDTVRSLEDELPRYLVLTGPSDSKKNSHYVSVRALNNMLRGFLPQRSPKMARNVMRGQTTPIFWIDEAASLYNIDISLPVLLMAGNSARHEAAAMGNHYGTILTSNAGDKADKSARFIYKMLQESAVWSELFYDADDIEDLKTKIKANSPSGEVRINGTFSHRQLGYSDEWLRNNWKAAMASGRDAEKDLLNRWKDGSAESPLSKKDLQTIADSLKSDLRNEIDPDTNYVIRYFISKEEFNNIANNSGVVLATDTSDAVGRDDISFVGLDIRNGAVVCAATINEVNLLGYATWLGSWLINYKKTILIPERRSSGVTIIDIIIEQLLAKSIDPFTRIFNWVIHDIDKHPLVQKELKKPLVGRSSQLYIQYRKDFGYGTSSGGRAARNNLYGATLTQAVKYAGSLIYDPIIINQLTSLVVRNGRIDHPDGEHDDMVVGWLLAYWLIIYGKNLNYYTIDPTQVMSLNPLLNDADEKDKHNKTQMALVLKNSIVELSKSIIQEKDKSVATLKEIKLKRLIEDSKHILGDSISVTDVLEKIKKR